MTGNVLAEVEALSSAGLGAEAEALCNAAVANNPGWAAAWAMTGALAQRRGDPVSAIRSFERAVELDPDEPLHRSNLARLLAATGRTDEAIENCTAALRLRPGMPEALVSLGHAFRHVGMIARAANAYAEAVASAPSHPEALNCLGNAETELGRPEQAVERFNAALAVRPGDVMILVNLGCALRESGRFVEAMRCFDIALEAAPEYADGHVNRALLRLLTGDYTRGWAELEWRHTAPGWPLPPRLLGPEWNGEPLQGRTILISDEQGFGDSIQLCRYAPLVADRGGNVILRVRPELVRLMASLRGVAEVVATDLPLPKADCVAHFYSLPRLFGTALLSVPNVVPYLSADPARVATWRKRFAGPGLKVGLVWAGRASFKGDAWRSPGLGALLPLFEVANARFFSLQLGDGRRSLAADAPAGLVDLGPELADFAETAAAMTALDVVVSSCTAPAHLAGALAVPVMILLAPVPDWRWGTAGASSLWYPTAQLYRARNRGDWSAPVTAIADRLRAMT